MTRGSKALLTLVLAVIAAGAVYYFFFARRASAPLPPVPNLVALLPADSTAIAYVDWAALRESSLVNILLAAMPAPTEDKDYAEFARATGFDYARDLDRVALAIEPGGRANTAVAVAEGRFDQQKIIAYALRTGRRIQQSGRDIYLVPSGNPPKTIAVTFLSDSRIALADGAPLPGSLNLTGNSTLDPAMTNRLARISGSPVLGLGRVGNIPKDANFGGWVPDSLLAIARSVRWLTFAAKPEGEQLFLALEAECESAGDALQLSWTLESARLLARMALSDPKTRKQMDPALAALLEKILRDGKISRTDLAVRFSFSLTARDLGAPAPAKAQP